MRRTLTRGWLHGISTGAGIAVGDGIYAAVAALGLAGVSSFMIAYERPLHAAAGLLLLYLGVRTIWHRPSDSDLPTPRERLAGSARAAFAGAVLLTLTNPPTIVMFAAIFAALSPPDGFQPGTALVTVAGVTAGSLVWWFVLTGAVSLFRHAIGVTARRWIDRIAGIARPEPCICRDLSLRDATSVGRLAGG
jgi:threonine/homoserine/homoserine lactone efflux protein